MALNTTTGTGTQASTGTPQTVGEANTTAQSGSVQPGTANSLLTSNQGVSLNANALTTVDLTGTKTSTATVSTTPPTTQKHDINPVALGFCALLFIVAILMFVFTSRSAKNTT